MRAELFFSCAYARTYARFFSTFVLGVCSFSSVVMIDVCLVSYNVLKFVIVLVLFFKNIYMHKDFQTRSMNAEDGCINAMSFATLYQ